MSTIALALLVGSLAALLLRPREPSGYTPMIDPRDAERARPSPPTAPTVLPRQPSIGAQTIALQVEMEVRRRMQEDRE